MAKGKKHFLSSFLSMIFADCDTVGVGRVLWPPIGVWGNAPVFMGNISFFILPTFRFIPVAQKKGMAFLKTFSCKTFSYASKKWLVQTEFNSYHLHRSQPNSIAYLRKSEYHSQAGSTSKYETEQINGYWHWRPDMILVQLPTLSDFEAKNFTPEKCVTWHCSLTTEQLLCIKYQ